MSSAAAAPSSAGLEGDRGATGGALEGAAFDALVESALAEASPKRPLGSCTAAPAREQATASNSSAGTWGDPPRSRARVDSLEEAYVR